MAEAIFTLSADITPQLDERALEQQAQILSNHLNRILAKQIDKVSIRPETGNFRPFQQEIDKTRSFVDKLQQSIGAVPRALGNVVRAGRSGFLKFSDAVNLTRRNMVGFGKGIRETIRDTNLFENALDGIKAAGGVISELPEQFEDLAAQIRSGTSEIDRAAAGGDKLAQLFQPLQRQGEAARTEFVELNRSVDLLTAAVQSLASASNATGSVIKSQFGQPVFNQQIQSMEELLEIVKESPVLFAKMKGSIDQANSTGTLDGIFQELLQIKDAAQVTTGVMGRLAQFINEQSGGRFFANNTKEAREFAIELEQGAIAKLRELGGGALLGPIENLTARFRAIRASLQGAINALNAFRTGLASILPGASPLGKLVDSIADSVTFFRVLRAEGVPALQAIRQAAAEAFKQFKDSSGLTTAIQRIKSELAGLGLVISQTKIGQKLNESLGSAGDFINRNLIGPLKAAGPQIKQAFSGIGKDIANGLGIGIDSGKSSVFKKMQDLAKTARAALQRVLRIHSASEATKEDGRDAALGFAQGIEQGKGAVAKAMAGLGAIVKSLGIGAFFKSAAAVAATTLAGLGAVALKTGADFNILKQVIGATLPVLVGSKQAAADLLIEVNKLNDSSPFARSAFLELTRVLAGFGVEAEKITPLIDAIQQTVAATGGTDQDLLELGQAFAKIQSQGRVSADVLQSFSVRGVDAIGVLAKGFKVTTGEMRTMISDGLVPAGKAIDALTTGLKEKFDGATDAVAKNFPGALQRVQARLRDIGGTLLTAFINPAGGGALVDFLNNMADSLSHVNKELLPKLAPALEIVGNLLVSFSEKVELVVKSLSGDAFGEFVNKLKPWLPVLAALVGLIPAAFGFIPVIGPIIAGLGGPFTAIAAAMAVFLAQSGKLGDVMSGMGDGLNQAKEAASGALPFIKDNLGGVALAATGSLGIFQKFITTIGSTFAFITKGVPVLAQLGKAFAFVGNLVGKFIGFIGKLAPGIVGLVGGTGKLAGVLKVVTGPIGTVVLIIAQLILTSQKFREALGRLWEAVKPVAQVIGQVLAVAIKILDEALKALEPVFVLIVDVLAAVFRAWHPVINGVKEFLGFMQKHQVIEKFFGIIKTAIETVITVINDFIDILDKALGPFINLPEIKIDVKVDADAEALKKAQEEAKKKAAELAKVAKAAGDAIQDNFNKASKAVELTKQKMDAAIDSLKQGISSVDQKLSPLFAAAKALQAANQAVVDARQGLVDANTKFADSTAALGVIEKDRARALEDVISPVNELAVATRNLTRIQNSLRDLDRELITLGKERAKLARELVDLAVERAKLLGEQAADDRAGLVRNEERAVINLNKATQAQIDLENELNGANKISLDLSGLSLAQIRAKLAIARATAKASSGERDETAQEKADRRTSARLDVEDAQQGVKDAGNAKLEFEEDTKNRIQEIDERTLEIGERTVQIGERELEIGDDRLDTLLDIDEALKGINRLREGETSQQKIILDFDDKIKTAKEAQATAAKAIETASKGIETAIHNAKGTAIDLRIKTAEISGDVGAIAAAWKASWEHQQTGLTFNAPIKSAIDEQIGKVGLLLTEYKNITAELQKQTQIQAAAQTLVGVGTSLGSFETQRERNNKDFTEGGASPARIQALQRTKQAVVDGIRAALAAGAAEVKATKQPAILSGAQIDAIINAILRSTEPLRDAIRIALNNAGLSMPGFAAARGLSPGMIHQGMRDGVGLVRMFEFGKEAVLPLTRAADMARIINDPRVLPAVLKALPGFAGGFAPDDVIDNALTSPSSNLRKLMQDIFQRLGMQFPGFATGYAPGDLAHTSLSSLQPFSLSNLNPTSSILPKILDSLPRWSSPAAATMVDETVTTGDLASVVRSARSGEGPANADVYQKKAQREMASTIGEAVKIAVMEALVDSEGLGDRNATINVNPNATETQRMIAREVKRQLDKATGKW